MANISISGISNVIRGQYTNTLGWLPGIAVVDIAPVSSLPSQIVNMSFYDGVNTITLLDCRIDRVKTLQTTRGIVTRLWIKDRRWRWMGLGHVSGTYNVPLQDMSIMSGTEKTPWELMSLVLTALGEVSFSVANMPNTHRPFVSWEMAVPAVAGDELLSECGCDIAYNPATNGVGVVRLGFGLTPTFTNAQSYTAGIDTAELPSSITAVAGRTTYQARLKLEPVAIETTLRIVPANSVSYAPAGGWTDEDDFDDLLSDQDVTVQSLANQSIGRLWRPQSFSDGSNNLPGYGGIPSWENVLPLRPTLNDKWQSDDGYEVEALPYLSGVMAVRSDLVGTENTEHRRIDEPFELDHETGIVSTKRPLFKLSETDGIDFADVFLTASMYLRDEAFRYHRHSVFRSIPGAPASPTLVLRLDDTKLEYTAVYNADGTTVDGVTDNRTAVEARLNAAIDAAIGQFQARASSTVIMSGLWATATSGLVRQVTYSVRIRLGEEENCIQTFVQMNTETEQGMPLYRERRRRLIAQEAYRQWRNRHADLFTLRTARRPR